MMEFIHFSGAPTVIVKSLPFSLSGATIEDRSVAPAGRQHRKVEPWNKRSFFGARRERKSVEAGTSVSVRVDLGGRRSISHTLCSCSPIHITTTPTKYKKTYHNTP